MNQEQESRFFLVAVALAVLFGVWFFSIREVFSPFILSLIIIGFLIPFRQHKSIRVLIALTFTLMMIWLFYFLQEIVNPFLISFALAYLFDPVVDKLEARRIPRTASILLIIVFIVGALAFFGLTVIPQFTEEVRAVATTFPSYEEIKQRIRLDWLWFFQSLGINVDEFLRTMETESTQKINELLKEFSQSAMGITTTLSSVVTQLINLILIPFITFYFLKDFDRLIGSARSQVPERHRELADKIYDRVNTILSLYIRGKILAAALIAVITSVALALLDIHFSLIIGLMAGLFSLIPYVGVILMFLIGIALGLLNPNPVGAMLRIVIVLGIINVADMVIISPKVVGEKLGLHPLLLIFSLFVFAKILGVVGLLISIPVTAILKVFVTEWYEQNFFRQEFLRDDSSDTKKGGP